MAEHRIFSMPFGRVYPAYVNKVERKGRSKDDLDRIICWLTGYTAAGLAQQIANGCDIRTFFAQAPAMHPNTALITGVVCGVRVEEVEDPLMQQIRWLDKLVDELAKGKAMEKILRAGASNNERPATASPMQTPVDLPSKSQSTHPNAAAFPPGLSGPALRALANAGIGQLEQLTGWTEANVAALHGMGPKGVRVLHQALTERNWRFR